ncbi:MAG: UDP-N-acetylmuramoyl-L-alanyl-D-glutamate--2,6-diaminopimelate ligase [Candidatus Omnitrophota bacterium]|jgi:UDP-N-acetylmuramoyl-L-alanyl-D-glutamate--2,6-diaminopimelate ligase
MKLTAVLKNLKYETKHNISDVDVKKLSCDSRTVGKGDIFVAFRGYGQDGHKFIEEAIRKGAGVIAAESDFDAPDGVIKIFIKDTRTALPVMADNFYGHPSEKLKVIGVTGTNGKTTITYIIENIIKAAGEEAGVIGTINYRIKDKIIPAKNTTPGPIELQSMLSEMVSSGIRYAVMEASSHSLDQHRMDSVRLDVAIFTNITPEHLDYHKTMSGYLQAKAKIFARLKPNGSAILNKDCGKTASLKGSIKRRPVTYSTVKDADVWARDIKLSIDGSKFTAMTPDGSYQINAKLIGMHNVSNMLAAIAAAYALKIDPAAVKKGVETIACVPGRLESVDAGQPFKVLVDYAHTEDAMRNVLNLLKGVARKKILTVFGCGGDRDTGKRPLMGRAACEFSDHVIVTSDNPRSEDPLKIILDIEKGIKGKFSNYDMVPDRYKAIEKALHLASIDDIVVIVGKGHENYQIISDRVLAFDDRQVAREILGKGNYADRRDSKDSAGQAFNR